MREPRPIPGSKTPLFDRLSDDALNVRQPVSPSRSLDFRSLRAAVRRDLSDLLNTRTSLKGTVRELSKGTILDFGVPALSSVDPFSDSQRLGLALTIEKIISTYEPRLRNSKVIIQQDKRDPRYLLGMITAELVFGNISEPVYFPLSLDESGKKIDVAASD